MSTTPLTADGPIDLHHLAERIIGCYLLETQDIGRRTLNAHDGHGAGRRLPLPVISATSWRIGPAATRIDKIR